MQSPSAGQEVNSHAVGRERWSPCRRIPRARPSDAPIASDGRNIPAGTYRILLKHMSHGEEEGIRTFIPKVQAVRPNFSQAVVMSKKAVDHMTLELLRARSQLIQSTGLFHSLAKTVIVHIWIAVLEEISYEIRSLHSASFQSNE
jgi:hypothetical protein